MSLMPHEYVIHRFDSTDKIPIGLLINEPMYHISKTEDELSIVCRSSILLASKKISKLYKCLKILGPLDFELVGIISRVAEILKNKAIPIFVISTFDTDYILINKNEVTASIKALSEDEYISIKNTY